MTKALLVQHPSGYWELLADLSFSTDVVVVPDVGDFDLGMNLARKSLAKWQRQIWDNGYLNGFGYFSLLTAERASLDQERVWNSNVIQSMERELERLRDPDSPLQTGSSRKMMKR